MEHPKPAAESAPAASEPAPAPAPPPEPDFGYAPPEHYDASEYRWVPVKRVPRRDGWTEEKQRRFIEVLADTGLVSRAARDVGMSREAAYKLRRAPHAAAFARAWDRAREQAGALVEDIAFERAFEGVETEVYAHDGALTGSKTVYNDRLLTFLLRHLKPERYGTVTQMRGGAWPDRGQGAAAGTHEPLLVPGPAPGDAPRELPAPSPDPDETQLPDTLDAALRALEPTLPAPAEELLDAETLQGELLLAEVADGKLPRHLKEQRAVKSKIHERADYLAKLHARGREIDEARNTPDAVPLQGEDFAAWCLYYDPTQAKEIPRKWRTPK